MDVKAEVLEIIEDLFMEDVSDMMDEDLFDAGFMFQSQNLVVTIGIPLIKLSKV